MNATDLIQVKDITLRRLAQEDIEMVRIWRNSPHVQQWMEFQEIITSEMQLNWFKKLDSKSQYFYIIQHKGSDVGLVNIKNVSNGSGEGGIFIGNETQINGTVGLAAILAMYDFGFNVLKLNQIIAHILESNLRAIRFNKSLGFVIQPNQEDKKNKLWIVNKEQYFQATKKIRSFV